MKGFRNYVEGAWEWIEPRSSAPYPEDGGHHLLLGTDRQALLEIAREEVNALRAMAARISLEPVTARREYACCLHARHARGEGALIRRLGINQGIRYGGWMGKGCTIGDFYRTLCTSKEELLR